MCNIILRVICERPTRNYKEIEQFLLLELSMATQNITVTVWSVCALLESNTYEFYCHYKFKILDRFALRTIFCHYIRHADRPEPYLGLLVLISQTKTSKHQVTYNIFTIISFCKEGPRIQEVSI
jgi:hypothetical protein